MHSACAIAGRILLVLLLFSSAQARRSEQSRLVRTLTGTSEEAKLRELDKLAKSPKQRDAALADLIDAATAVADKAVKHDTPGLPASTLALLDLVGSSSKKEATQTLIKLLHSEHLQIAMASAEALGRHNHTSSLLVLSQQIARLEYASSYAFRFSLLKSIALLRSPEAVEFISKTLPTLDGQLKHEVVKFLSQVEVSYFGGDKRKFEDWKTNTWESLQASGFTELQSGSSHSYRSEQYERATYYGMPIYAQRLIFVIDCSPSMDELVEGKSRLRRAIIELARAISALDPTTEFTVVAFGGRVKTWHKKLVEASPKNKKDAIKFVRNHDRSNLTNTYAAILTTLNIDENTEAIYLISDGEPTTGRVTNPSKIVDEITRRNSFRYISINTIGISLAGAAHSFMQELAVQNGGEYRDTE